MSAHSAVARCAELRHFIAARLEEDALIVLATGDPWGWEKGNPPPESPEHWHWECCADDVSLPLDGPDEYLRHKVATCEHEDDHYRVGLRSAEEYPSFSAGTLPHLVIDHDEVRMTDARFMVRYDPAAAMAAIQSKQRILAWASQPVLSDYDVQQLLEALAWEWHEHPEYAGMQAPPWKG